MLFFVIFETQTALFSFRLKSLEHVSHVLFESAKWRAQCALRAQVPYLPYVATRPTRPRAQVYFTAEN